MDWRARGLRFGGWLALVALATPAICQVQEAVARPGFEVASIRLHTSADSTAYVQALQGRLVMTNFTLKQLILFAYGIPNSQVSGVQSWMDSDHFDIQATSDSSTTVKEVEGRMLQALLEERFHLKIHRETVERPVYELTVDKGGAKLRLSKEGSCTPYSMESAPPVPAAGAPRPNYCDFPRLIGDGFNRKLEGTGVSVGKLAASLSRSGLNRPVIDRTGLSGGFDLQLTWAADATASAPGSGVDDPAGLSIFTALKEQLGLKLEATKGPVEVLVIDHVERPSEN
jgi:uncharacterized protein (TIGR03435 family)